MDTIILPPDVGCGDLYMLLVLYLYIPTSWPQFADLAYTDIVLGDTEAIFGNGT